MEKLEPILSANDVEKILGKPKYSNEMYKTANMPGVAVGLAWTYVGGDILFIETSLSDGKGELKLTGNLGNVMKESASTALTYLQANAKKYGIDPKIFDKEKYSYTCARRSCSERWSKCRYYHDDFNCFCIYREKSKTLSCMTGEITLRGQVLPVGGIKEKVLAAKRAGLKEIILCWQNEKDVEEIDPDFIKGINFIM